MFAKVFPSCSVDDFSRLCSEVVSEECLKVEFAEKADALTVFALGIGKVELLCFLADFIFGQGADGEEGSLELSLVESSKEVGLILDGIGSSEEESAVSTGACASIVSRGDFFVFVVDGVIEYPKFYLLVAEDVGVGCPPCFDFIEGVCDDTFPVGALEGEDFEGNVVVVADRLNVREVFFPRAGAEKGEFVFEPDF